MIVLDPSRSSPASVVSYSGYANLSGSMAITNQNTILMIGPYGLLFNLSHPIIFFRDRGLRGDPSFRRRKPRLHGGAE